MMSHKEREGVGVGLYVTQVHKVIRVWQRERWGVRKSPNLCDFINEKPLSVYVRNTNFVTSFKKGHTCHQFLSILYWSNGEYWSQKCTQNGNIHSTKLDVYAEKQSASNLSFISSQLKQGRKYNALASSPLITHQNWWDTSFVELLFGKSWKSTRKHRISEKKLDSLSNL